MRASLPQSLAFASSPSHQVSSVALSSRSLSVASEHNYLMLSLITLLHLAALLWILNPLLPDAAPAPVLAFTVTLTDVASSPNTVASAASTPAQPENKPQPQKKVQPVTPHAKSATPKKAIKPVTQQEQATTPREASAQQQTAVLAPITPAVFDAAYLNNPPPSYPPLSRRMGEQGIAKLNVYVNPQGQPEQITLKTSSGYERLDSAALNAVKKWRFIAAKQGNALIASWVTVPVKFVLE